MSIRGDACGSGAAAVAGGGAAGQGSRTWYPLTADRIRTAEDAWTVVLAYVRRWQNRAGVALQ